MRCTFDASLALFRHHFQDDPIVPGALLLDHYAAHVAGAAARGVANFSDVRFHRFVRPGSIAEFTAAGDAGVELRVDGALCCAFDVDASGGHAASSRPALPGPLAPIPIASLRDPAYWFLDGRMEIDADGCWATCRVDLDECARAHAWLAELPRWRPLLLIESAGNLAWAMQDVKAPLDASSRYVLARFDAVDYRVDCSGWSAQQTIVTHVRRHGSLLVWDAWVVDDASTQIAIRGAVSRKERPQ